jgi:hypothetical protein
MHFHIHHSYDSDRLFAIIIEYLEKIEEKLTMSQVSFDKQLQALNDELDIISNDIKQFIANQPKDTDTSALDSVVTRLDNLDTELVPPTPAPVVDVVPPTDTTPQIPIGG